MVTATKGCIIIMEITDLTNYLLVLSAILSASFACGVILRLAGY